MLFCDIIIREDKREPHKEQPGDHLIEIRCLHCPSDGLRYKTRRARALHLEQPNTPTRVRQNPNPISDTKNHHHPIPTAVPNTSPRPNPPDPALSPTIPALKTAPLPKAVATPSHPRKEDVQETPRPSLTSPRLSAPRSPSPSPSAGYLQHRHRNRRHGGGEKPIFRPPQRRPTLTLGDRRSYSRPASPPPPPPPPSSPPVAKPPSPPPLKRRVSFSFSLDEPAGPGPSTSHSHTPLTVRHGPRHRSTLNSDVKGILKRKRTRT